MGARIFVDMDDVLVDFSTGAARAHGLTREELEERRQPGEWNTSICLTGGNLDRFWEPIHAQGERFWRDLQPLPHATDLLQHVRRLTGDWLIVSAPSRCPTSYAGKVAWLKEFFGKDFDRFALVPHKELFAGPKTILIDDRTENCDRFQQAGGMSVLFPSHGNRRYDRAGDPLWVLPELERKVRYASEV